MVTTMSDLGITSDDINVDLNSYYQKIYANKALASNIQRSWKSVEEYVNILYYLKFVKKLDYSEMGRLVGKKNFGSFYCNNNLGWHYNTNNFEECVQLHREYMDRLKREKDDYKEDLPEFLDDHYTKWYIQVRGNLSNAVIKHMGFSSEKELLKQIYYLFVIKEMSVQDLAYLYERPTATVRGLIRKIGLSLGLKGAQQRAVKSGKRNYKQVNETGRKTMIDNMLKTGLIGSKAENVCRTMLDNIFGELFSTSYEIIVGINTRNIIAPKEIDIPIVIFNKKTGNVYKIAVEVDGICWHDSERIKVKDGNKKIQILRNGWSVMKFEYSGKSNEYYDTEFFKEQVKTLGEKIYQFVVKKENEK